MDLKEEDILGSDIGRHWYYRSKAAALRRMVSGLRPHNISTVLKFANWAIDSDCTDNGRHLHVAFLAKG